MSIDELKKLIEFGCDIMFKYNGKGYTILSAEEIGVSIGTWNGEDDKVFKNYDDFILNCKLEENYFRDVLKDVEITFSSGYTTWN